MGIIDFKPLKPQEIGRQWVTTWCRLGYCNHPEHNPPRMMVYRDGHLKEEDGKVVAM